MDWYRFTLMSLTNKKASVRIQEFFNEKYLDIIDDLQLIFDKSEFSSEIHLVLKNN
ncbi:hypothetical protein [Lysinibacillus sp. RC79]|uniref:hypothetical protein n=1 Tax=Lysinibacillus sp. RC79 TaxID=3156296 RepID=UPI0035140FD0